MSFKDRTKKQIERPKHFTRNATSEWQKVVKETNSQNRTRSESDLEIISENNHNIYETIDNNITKMADIDSLAKQCKDFIRHER